MISNLTMRLNWGDKSPRVNFYAQNCTYFCRLPKKIKSALSIDAGEIWRERTFPRTFWYHGCRWEQLLYHLMLLFVFEIGKNVKLLDNFLPFFPHDLHSRTICGDLSPQFNVIMFIGTIFIAPVICSLMFTLVKMLSTGHISTPILLFFTTAAAGYHEA